MFDPKATAAHFSRSAATYENYAQLQRLIRAESLQLARVSFPEDACVLDVGCGTGSLADEAALEHCSWKLTGIDLAFGMCQQAARRLPVVQADARALPFAEQQFDGLISSLMLQWATDPLSSLREMARVLKSGGRAVLSMFTQGTLAELEASFASIDASPHVSPFLAASEWSAYAAHAGFALLDAQEESFIEHYTRAISLMHSLKAIGATNALSSRRRSLMTPRQLQRVEAYYHAHYADKEGLPATWHALTLLVEKRST